MPCKAVNFLLGLCVIKRAGYQQKYRRKMLWSSLCVIKVAMIKKAKGTARNNLAPLSRVSSYVWVNDGDVVSS